MIRNIFMGFLIGVAKIMPGVSGSMLAITFGVYERSLKVVGNVFHIGVRDFMFLFTLFIGVLSGVLMFSGCVKWVFEHFYLPTMLLFSGMIMGGVKKLWLDIRLLYKEHGNCALGKVGCGLRLIGFVSLFCFSFCLVWLFSCEELFGDGLFFVSGEWSYFCLGVIEVFSSMIPGISGTAIYMSLGCYDIMLDFFSNLFNPDYFDFLLFFSFGILVTVVMVARGLTFLIERYRFVICVCVFGFMLGSFVMMLWPVVFEIDCFFDVLVEFFWFLSGYLFNAYFDWLLSRK